LRKVGRVNEESVEIGGGGGGGGGGIGKKRGENFIKEGGEGEKKKKERRGRKRGEGKGEGGERGGGGGMDVAGELKRNERKFYLREVGAE